VVNSGSPNHHSAQIQEEIDNLFDNIPCCKDDAVLEFVDSRARTIDRKQTPFVQIEGFADIDNDDLITIGNHFVVSIDVIINNGRGGRVKNKKGKAFGPYCLQPLGYVPPVTQIRYAGTHKHSEDL
jgi:hypothetical protein